MKKTLFIALFASLMLAGCFTRTVQYVEEHEKAPTLLITTDDHWNFLIFQRHTQQFWECLDSGKQVTCKKACGDGTDLQCPVAIGDANNFNSSNK